MAEQNNKQPDATKQVGQGSGLKLNPKAVEPQSEEKPVEEKIEPPVEISSVNKSIQIIKDGNEYTIRFAPLVAEEIGAYRRCNVCVKFTEGGRVQVLQDVDKL